jgi:uncharacterized metal-binding protein
MQFGPKVGVVSCSGEDRCEGTISRLATRRVLEKLRPGKAATICLPLFLSGEAGEQAFARNFPTITVDGCDKLCAKCGTEQHSGPVAVSLVVTEILGEDTGLSGARSSRHLTEGDMAAVDKVAQQIAENVDNLILTANR